MNVSIEILEFPLCVKNKILRIKDITKLNIEYIAGKNIIFKNTNLGLIEPHKIIISNGIDTLVLLCYDDDTNLYNEELSDIVTISELTNIVNEFLEKNWKILNFIFPFVYKGKMVFLLSIFQNRAVACPKKMWYYGNIRQF